MQNDLPPKGPGQGLTHLDEDTIEAKIDRQCLRWRWYGLDPEWYDILVWWVRYSKDRVKTWRARWHWSDAYWPAGGVLDYKTWFDAVRRGDDILAIQGLLDVALHVCKREERKRQEEPPGPGFASANPYTITTRWSVRNFFRHKQWNLPPSEWLGAPKEQHVEEHVPRNWFNIPERDRWPIQRIVRDERGWCMAHGIPGVPMMNMERESYVDTHENWFAYGNFQQWWFHLTPAQRWLLWEKRGGSTEWQPPEDFEGHSSAWNPNPNHLNPNPYVNPNPKDLAGHWKHPPASVHFDRHGMHVNV